MTAHLGGPETEEQLAARHRRYAEPGPGRIYRVTLADGGETVGSIGYWQRTWRGAEVWETGWAVLPEFQRRGSPCGRPVRCGRRPVPRGTHRYLHAFPSVDHAASNAVCAGPSFALLGQADLSIRRATGSGRTTGGWTWRRETDVMCRSIKTLRPPRAGRRRPRRTRSGPPPCSTCARSPGSVRPRHSREVFKQAVEAMSPGPRPDLPGRPGGCGEARDGPRDTPCAVAARPAGAPGAAAGLGDLRSLRRPGAGGASGTRPPPPRSNEAPPATPRRQPGRAQPLTAEVAEGHAVGGPRPVRRGADQGRNSRIRRWGGTGDERDDRAAGGGEPGQDDEGAAASGEAPPRRSCAVVSRRAGRWPGPGEARRATRGG